MQVTVFSRSGRKLYETTVDLNDKLLLFRKEWQKEKKTSLHRQRFTVIQPERLIPKPNPNSKSKRKPSFALTDENKTWKDYGFNLDDNVHLAFKDLGPQIGWQTVFLIEYFGPLLAHAIPYYFPSFVYGVEYPESSKALTQKISFWLVIFHYLKREFETLFIHRFSSATMPIRNIFKNSSHYWILGGIFISYFLYHPKYTQPFTNPTIIYGLSLSMILMEFGNLFAHITLKNLRPPGTKKRGIPKGGLYNLVSCANYTYETGAWLCFSILTNCLTSYLFLFISFGQMTQWAFKKHKRYKKEFKDYPKGRKAILPFIL